MIKNINHLRNFKMNKYRDPMHSIHETYRTNVLPVFSHDIDGTKVDFTKICESVSNYLSKILEKKVKIEFKTISSNVFVVESMNLYDIPSFKNIVIEDSDAMWKDDKLCVEFRWKYTERSGRVIKGDPVCRIEVDASGKILKEHSYI